MPWTYFINDRNGEETVRTFREKAINYMLNGKDAIVRLIAE